MTSVLKTSSKSPTVDDLVPYQIGLKNADSKENDKLYINDNGTIVPLVNNSLKAQSSYSTEYCTTKDNLRSSLLEKYVYVNGNDYAKIDVLDQKTGLIGFASNIATTFNISIELQYDDGTSFYTVKRIKNDASDSLKTVGNLTIKSSPTESDYTTYEAAFADTTSNSSGSTEFYVVTKENPVLAHYTVKTSDFTYVVTAHRIDDKNFFIEDSLVLEEKEE